MREGQDKLRQSASEQGRLMNELSSFQQRLKKLSDENEGLTGQVREGQEKLRLSNNTVTNLNR